MDYRGGIVISVSLLLVTAQPDPSDHTCTRLSDLSEPCGCLITHESFNPVCGSDGNTYLSDCFLECRKAVYNVCITVDYKGICNLKSQCICPVRYAPLCGTNGVTYSNDCVLNCYMKKDSSIQLRHVGKCGNGVERRLYGETSKENKPGKCPCDLKLRRYYNGQSYARSSCGCRPRKHTIVQTDQPVSTDPPTHNTELLASETVQPAKETDQPSSGTAMLKMCDEHTPSRGVNLVQDLYGAVRKKCVCAMVHKPVCGNNQKTYTSLCVLHCSAKRNPKIRLLHWGTCANTH